MSPMRRDTHSFHPNLFFISLSKLSKQIQPWRRGSALLKVTLGMAEIMTPTIARASSRASWGGFVTWCSTLDLLGAAMLALGRLARIFLRRSLRLWSPG